MHPHRPRPRWIPLPVIGCVLALLAHRGWAGDSPRPTAPLGVASIPSDPIFAALLTDGSVVSGRVVQVDAAQGVTLAGAGGEERTIAVGRLVKLTRDGSIAPPMVEGGIVLLPRGDRLTRCVIKAAGDTTLSVLWESTGGTLAVPLDGMIGLILDPPKGVDAVDAFEARVRGETRAAEQLWLANGDKLDGLFAGLTDKQVMFQPPTGRVALARPAVTAIGFNPAQVVEQDLSGPFYEWLLLDGSRLGLGQTRIDHGLVVGQTRFGVEVRIPLGEVARIRVLNSSVVYLSDRDADKVVYESYLGPTRPYRRGASVVGPALRLGGQTYDRGLGTQSRTLLAYRLDPKAKRFQALVGLDDAAGPLGNVVFKVLVDGKPRYESPSMGAGEAPRAVDVALEGGKVLILTTEFGERGDVQDSGDWVEARIVR